MGIHLGSKFSTRKFIHSSGSPSNKVYVIPKSSFPKRNFYAIDHEQQTASASLLFASHVETKERVVIKILKDSKIIRYSLVASEERLGYQLEALYWNKKFAPGIYIGLARILGWSYDPISIVLGEIIENPIKESIDSRGEYALVMRELPVDRRLDILLNKRDKESLQSNIRILTEYVAYMHTELVEPAIPTHNIRWGSFEQLQKKLEHNLELIDQLLDITESSQYRASKDSKYLFKLLHLLNLHRRNVPKQIIVSEEQNETLKALRSNLREILRKNPYQGYFEKRLLQQRIKRCHGDLKAPHIWVIPNTHFSDTESWEHVRVIDAIDFDPTFCNIDILSDLSMLVLDIQARTNSFVDTSQFIEGYLQLTRQEDKISRAVLTFYLIEKAIMWIAVSI